MKDSIYRTRIIQGVDALGDDFVLTGSMLLVEKVEQEEVKTKSGLVLASSTAHDSILANVPHFVHVLAVGAGYITDEGSDAPLDTLPGDILLVGQASVKWLSTFPVEGYKPFTIGVTSEAETQMRFRGIEAYQRFTEAVNKPT